jgi:hypothetical protein
VEQEEGAPRPAVGDGEVDWPDACNAEVVRGGRGHWIGLLGDVNASVSASLYKHTEKSKFIQAD